MLETVKTYIWELPDTPFSIYYQNYICDVQDQNILLEVSSIKTEEVLTLERLMSLIRRKIQ